jgi:hypothetical protein
LRAALLRDSALAEGSSAQQSIAQQSIAQRSPLQQSLLHQPLEFKLQFKTINQTFFIPLQPFLSGVMTWWKVLTINKKPLSKRCRSVIKAVWKYKKMSSHV